MNFLNAQIMQEDEGDRLGLLPHPRETLLMQGHQAQEETLLKFYQSGKMPHALIFAGEEGIGKATMAYRFARFILANPRDDIPEVQSATSLHVKSNSFVSTQLAALSHPDCFVLRRGLNASRKAMAIEIRAENVREAMGLFARTASGGGWRIMIVDCADQLNASSANALLKTLEEPPAKALFLIISHAPGRLLPTIRSRCRVLHFKALSEESISQILPLYSEYFPENSAHDMEVVAQASGGSVRRAFQLLNKDRLKLRGEIEGLLAIAPRFPSEKVDQLAEKLQGRAGQESLAFFIQTLEDWLQKELLCLAQTSSAKAANLSDIWQELHQDYKDIGIYNLDARPFIINLFSKLASIVH